MNPPAGCAACPFREGFTCLALHDLPTALPRVVGYRPDWCPITKGKVSLSSRQQIAETLARDGHAWFYFGSYTDANGRRIDYPPPLEIPES